MNFLSNMVFLIQNNHKILLIYLLRILVHIYKIGTLVALTVMTHQTTPALTKLLQIRTMLLWHCLPHLLDPTASTDFLLTDAVNTYSRDAQNHAEVRQYHPITSYSQLQVCLDLPPTNFTSAYANTQLTQQQTVPMHSMTTRSKSEVVKTKIPYIGVMCTQPNENIR